MPTKEPTAVGAVDSALAAALPPEQPGFFNKPIGMPRQAAVIIATSFLCGISYLFSDRGGIMMSTLCGEIAYFFGPLLCLYLFFRLFCTALSAKGKHTVSFAVGTFFGFGTFFIWLYEASRH
jgi:hypothetical protein